MFLIVCEMIVDGKFLTLADRSFAEVQYVAADNASLAIRFATVIDKFGAAATRGAINRPVAVEREDVVQRPRGTDFGFAAADAFTRVFDHLPVRRYVLARVNAPAVNLRLTQP